MLLRICSGIGKRVASELRSVGRDSYGGDATDFHEEKEAAKKGG
jgi:hypothetical protein